jgi:hypothetical protein
MKIILATSLSLLFSASVYADNYLVDADSDCKVWSPDPIGQSETISYTVQCVDGKAHGKGSLTVYDNGRKSRYYDGEFQNGKWQSEKGSITTYQNGEQITYNQGKLENRDIPNGS